MSKRIKTGYYSAPSGTWHRTIDAALVAAKKALRGTGETGLIHHQWHGATGVRTIVVGTVHDPDIKENQSGARRGETMKWYAIRSQDITGATRTFLVDGFRNSPAYTREEWLAGEMADYELDTKGDLLFQGQPFYAARGWRRVPLPKWAK